MKKPRIVMVICHRAFYNVLKDLLCEVCDCVGRSHKRNDTLDLIRSLRPDIVLMDLESSKGYAIQTIFTIKKEMPEIKVIALSDLDLELYQKMSLTLGASGYVLKDNIHSDLVSEIRRVWADEVSEVFSIKTHQ